MYIQYDRDIIQYIRLIHAYKYVVYTVFYVIILLLLLRLLSVQPAYTYVYYYINWEQNET